MGDGYHVALYRLNLADPLGRIQLVNDLQKCPGVHTALATDSVLAVFFAHLVENPVDKENKISCQQIGNKTCWIPVITCREKSPCQQIGKKTCWIPVITCREKSPCQQSGNKTCRIPVITCREKSPCQKVKTKHAGQNMSRIFSMSKVKTKH